MSLIHYHLMGNMNMLKLKEDILTIKTKTKQFGVYWHSTCVQCWGLTSNFIFIWYVLLYKPNFNDWHLFLTISCVISKGSWTFMFFSFFIIFRLKAMFSCSVLFPLFSLFPALTVPLYFYGFPSTGPGKEIWQCSLQFRTEMDVTLGIRWSPFDPRSRDIFQ